MRQRLLSSTLTAVAAVVVLLGVPLLLAFERLTTGAALDSLQQQAGIIAAAMEQADLAAAEEPIALAALAADRGVRLMLYQRVGDDLVLRIDSAPDEPVPPFFADLGAASSGDVGRSYAAGVLAVSLPVQLESGPGVLRVLRSDDRLRSDIVRGRIAIAVLGAVALCAAAVAANEQARRLAAPLEDLAAAARRLGDGDFSARAPRSGLPEADDVAAALDVTARRLANIVERSRSFSADASHQLRTPLTALRLDLEALEATGADQPLVAAAVAEADRLEATIDDLLALASEPSGEEQLDVCELAAQRLEAVRAVAAADGREVRLEAAGVPMVRARAAAIGQSLQVLLDNALEHGTGTITVRVDQVVGGVRLCVGDEGPGVPPGRERELFVPGPSSLADRPRSTGRGLPLARSLMEAEGGRLTLEQARPGVVVCLVLPVR